MAAPAADIQAGIRSMRSLQGCGWQIVPSESCRALSLRNVKLSRYVISTWEKVFLMAAMAGSDLKLSGRSTSFGESFNASSKRAYGITPEVRFTWQVVKLPVEMSMQARPASSDVLEIATKKLFVPRSRRESLRIIPGGDDSDNFPFDQTFGLGRVLNLFTHGNLAALFNKFGNIKIGLICRAHRTWERGPGCFYSERSVRFQGCRRP